MKSNNRDPNLTKRLVEEAVVAPTTQEATPHQCPFHQAVPPLPTQRTRSNTTSRARKAVLPH